MKRVGVVVVTGDRGLAGPFNGQVLRRAFELERQERADGPRGRVARRRAARAPRRCASAATRSTAQWAGFADKPTLPRRAGGRAQARRAVRRRRRSTASSLVYNRFVSALVQRVTTTDLLPIPEDVLDGRGATRTRRRRRCAATSSTSRSRRRSSSGCCPSTSRRRSTARCSSRRRRSSPSQMTAMRNASKNAGELIDTLHARR